MTLLDTCCARKSDHGRTGCTRRARYVVAGYGLCLTHFQTYNEYVEASGTAAAIARIEQGKPFRQQRDESAWRI